MHVHVGQSSTAIGDGLVMASLRPIGDGRPFVDVEFVVGDVVYAVCISAAEARCERGSGSGGLGALKRWQRGGGVIGRCLGGKRIRIRNGLRKVEGVKKRYLGNIRRSGRANGAGFWVMTSVKWEGFGNQRRGGNSYERSGRHRCVDGREECSRGS